MFYFASCVQMPFRGRKTLLFYVAESQTQISFKTLQNIKQSLNYNEISEKLIEAFQDQLTFIFIVTFLDSFKKPYFLSFLSDLW